MPQLHSADMSKLFINKPFKLFVMRPLFDPNWGNMRLQHVLQWNALPNINLRFRTMEQRDAFIRMVQAELYISNRRMQVNNLR